MPVTATRVTVGVTATLLLAPERRVRARIQNPVGGATVQLGGAGVSVAAGMDLVAGAYVETFVEPNDALYAIITAATQAIQVMYYEVD